MVGRDVIGDVRGRGDALARLLRKLGYADVDGTWRHPGGRRALFLGDVGTDEEAGVRALDVVLAMVAEGTADLVLGGWETAALARCGSGDPCALTPDRAEALAGCPLWFEGDGLRAVHACWDEGAMAAVSAVAGDRGVPGLEGARRLAGSTALARAVGRIVEGPTIADRWGGRVAARWWARPGTAARDLAVGARGEGARGRGPPPADTLVTVADGSPVVFGHHRFAGPPFLLSEDMGCLDFGGGMRPKLCALRFEGAGRLDARGLAWVELAGDDHVQGLSRKEEGPWTKLAG